MSLYPWQQTLWQHLVDYHIQQRLPQALLFTGNAGVGKRCLAEQFAALLLCSAPQNHQPCGVCHDCLLFNSQNHPDYLVITPEEPGKNITIEQIRKLNESLSLKPQYNGLRLVILDPADQLNRASANAFLKCLEEPNERTIIILITALPTKLPATIHSRCQKLDCSVIASQTALAWLQQQNIAKDAELLLKMANGAPLIALQLYQQDTINLRVNCFNTWLEIAKDPGKLINTAELWQKANTLDLSLLLSWISLWITDIIRLAHGCNCQQLSNPDLCLALQPLAQTLEPAKLFAYYDSLLRSKALLSTTVNKQLLLEQLLIDWWQLNRTAP